MLCHQAAEMATVSENESANASIENTEWNDITGESATALVPRKVILDVEGEKFHTSVETLTRTENTFFTELFSKTNKPSNDIWNNSSLRELRPQPTMTIIQSDNDSLFGGYTSVPWTSSDSKANDTTAFLFTLINPYDIPPTKYSINHDEAGNAAEHRSNGDPTFETGYDIYLSDGWNSNHASYTKFPCSHLDTTGMGNNTSTGARNFIVSDFEVFKLA
ncbi:unnamed protein product [Rotaria sp. Silwood2]|nr:unnamed protein product [Rotaria sp. Silwood2]